MTKIFAINPTTPTQKSKKQQVIETSATLVGSTALGMGTFGIVDTFSKNKKNYKDSLNEAKKTYNNNVQEKINLDIKRLEKMGKKVNENAINLIREYREMSEKFAYEEEVDSIKSLRKTHINKWLKISAGFGFGIGAIGLVAKNLLENNKTEIKKNVDKTALSNTNEKKKYCIYWNN